MGEIRNCPYGAEGPIMEKETSHQQGRTPAVPQGVDYNVISPTIFPLLP